MAEASDQEISAVLTEELGHHLDAVLNDFDTPGDEGEHFAKLLIHGELSDQSIAALSLQSDLITILADGQFWQAEASSAWQQVGNDIDGAAAGDEAGYSVSLSSDGKTIAVGSRSNDSSGSNAGHVRIYQLNGSDQWVQVGADINGEAADDHSGWSVSLSSDGRTVAIGAYSNDGSGSNSHVRIYQLNGSNQWVQLVARYRRSSCDFSGYSVSLSSDGKTVAIGAVFNDGGGSDSGHVRIYRLNGSISGYCWWRYQWRSSS